MPTWHNRHYQILVSNFYFAKAVAADCRIFQNRIVQNFFLPIKWLSSHLVGNGMTMIWFRNSARGRSYTEKLFLLYGTYLPICNYFGFRA